MASIVKTRLEVLDERLKLLTLPSLPPNVPIITKPFKESDEHQKSAKITLLFSKTPIIVNNI